MSSFELNVQTSISPELDDLSRPSAVNREPSPARSSTHSDLYRCLSNMLSSYTADIATCDSSDGTVVLTRDTICDRAKLITRVLDHMGPTPPNDLPDFRTIVPPELTDATSLSRAAATLDSTKIRILLASSKISLTDLNSYAQLLIAEQDAYRRAHRRSLPMDERAAAIYTPTYDEANRFVDDNVYIYQNFASLIEIKDYFQLLKVFTHESATEGKTSSKLLSLIGKHALKATTYRLSYINGESYAFARERVYKYLDDDLLFNYANSTKIPQHIIVGTDFYKFDREIVLQTVYALFGLFYALKGEEGLILLNEVIRWYDDTLAFS